MFLRFFIFSLVFFNLSLAYSDYKLKNFTPGEYIRNSGTDDQCGGEGYFSITEDFGYPQLNLGVHVLDIRNRTEEIEDNLKEGCVYKSQDKVEVVGDTTVLTFKSEHRCQGKYVSTLTKKMTIVKDNLSLHVAQLGEDKFDFRCTWIIPKRKIDSKNRPGK
ncbi:MAG: hypothetical protein KDD33_06095 [Bdellovibrionales bacterium]|nr:hypothetical protein [Bdellovibrionales bacterium]